MPFYEYQCKNCGHELEAMQKVSDSPLKKCPHCGKSQLQRLMSAPVFRLKGAGWYETDFKGEGDTKRNLADKPEADAPAADAKSKEDKSTDTAKGADAKTPAVAAADSKPTEKTDKAVTGQKAAPAAKASSSGSKKTGRASSPKARPAPRRPVKKAVAAKKRR
jgi:putative FmdB family regulatory protein